MVPVVATAQTDVTGWLWTGLIERIGQDRGAGYEARSEVERGADRAEAVPDRGANGAGQEPTVAHAVRDDVDLSYSAYAERIELRQDGGVVGEHARVFGRGQTVYDPWHYVPVLARKPGALCNRAPFKDWVLPAALDRVRRKLAGSADGDRQMVEILTAVLGDGLAAVEAACAEALREGVHSADVILNTLARQREPVAPVTLLTPEGLRHEPVADCARHDSLRRTP